jgi:hypothetical protein
MSDGCSSYSTLWQHLQYFVAAPPAHCGNALWPAPAGVLQYMRVILVHVLDALVLHWCTCCTRPQAALLASQAVCKQGSCANPKNVSTGCHDQYPHITRLHTHRPQASTHPLLFICAALQARPSGVSPACTVDTLAYRNRQQSYVRCHDAMHITSSWVRPCHNDITWTIVANKS